VRITPRAEEIREIVAMLESGDYDGPEALAKDLFKHIAGLLWFRESYVLGVRVGDVVYGFGPFYAQAEAAKFGKQYEGSLFAKGRAQGGDGWGVMKVYGVGQIAANAEEGREGGGYGYCTTEGCGCPPYAHLMSGTSRGRCLLCKVCPEYKQAEAKKKSTRKAKKDVN
jgi:hypothetical protein